MSRNTNFTQSDDGPGWGRDGLQYEENRARRQKQYQRSLNLTDPIGQRPGVVDDLGIPHLSRDARQSYRTWNSNRVAELVGGPTVESPGGGAVGRRGDGPAPWYPEPKPTGAPARNVNNRSMPLPSLESRAAVEDRESLWPDTQPPSIKSAQLFAAPSAQPAVVFPRLERSASPIRSVGMELAMTNSGTAIGADQTAEIERLRNQIGNEQRVIADLRGLVLSLESRFDRETETANDITARMAKLERDKVTEIANLKWQLSQDSSEVTAVRQLLKAQEERTDKMKSEHLIQIQALVADTRVLRSTVDSLTTEAAGHARDLAIRVKSLESSTTDGRKAVMTLEERERMFENLNSEFGAQVKTRFDDLEANIASLQQQLREEERKRINAEEQTRQVALDLTSVMRTRETEMLNRVEHTQSEAHSLVEGAELNRMKDTEMTKAQIQTEQQMRQESEANLDVKLRTKFQSLERLISEHHADAQNAEASLRQFLETKSAKIEARIAADALTRTQEDKAVRKEMIESLKALKESLHLVEEEGRQSRESLESVVRAEIKTRQQAEATNDVKFEALRMAIAQEPAMMETLIRNSETRQLDAHDQLRTHLSDELMRMRNENEMARLEMVDAVSALRKFTQETEARLSQSLSEYVQELDKHRHESVHALSQWKDYLQAEIEKVSFTINQVSNTSHENSERMRQTVTELDQVIAGETTARAEADQKLRTDLNRKVETDVVNTMQDANNALLVELEKRFQKLSATTSSNQQNIILLKQAVDAKQPTPLRLIDIPDDPNASLRGLGSPPPRTAGSTRPDTASLRSPMTHEQLPSATTNTPSAYPAPHEDYKRRPVDAFATPGSPGASLSPMARQSSGVQPASPSGAQSSSAQSGKGSIDEEAAATSIQAAYRGHQVRRQSDVSQIKATNDKPPTAAAGTPQQSAAFRNSPTPTAKAAPAAKPDDDDAEAQAAVKIQAAYRGHQVRKGMDEDQEEETKGPTSNPTSKPPAAGSPAAAQPAAKAGAASPPAKAAAKTPATSPAAKAGATSPPAKAAAGAAPAKAAAGSPAAKGKEAPSTTFVTAQASVGSSKGGLAAPAPAAEEEWAEEEWYDEGEGEEEYYEEEYYDEEEEPAPVAAKPAAKASPAPAAKGTPAAKASPAAAKASPAATGKAAPAAKTSPPAAAKPAPAAKASPAGKSNPAVPASKSTPKAAPAAKPAPAAAAKPAPAAAAAKSPAKAPAKAPAAAKTAAKASPAAPKGGKR